MDQSDLYLIEKWKDIPDKKYRYQASNLGRICNLYPDGTRRILKEIYMPSSDAYYVGLTDLDGVSRKHQIITLVSNVWLGKCKSDEQRIHKNGIKSDNRLVNIVTIKRKDFSKVANKNKRKSVLKIDKDFNIVDFYSSAKECSEKNYFCYSSIKRRCKGDFNSLFAEDGYAYVYEKRLGRFKKQYEEYVKNGTFDS